MILEYSKIITKESTNTKDVSANEQGYIAFKGKLIPEEFYDLRNSKASPSSPSRL